MVSSTPVTLLDVARRAGVSRTTASSALGSSGRVSEATRRRVRNAAEAMGYRVNRAAQSLRKAQVGAVGLYIPPFTSTTTYYMDFTFGVADVLGDNGVALMLFAGEAAARAILTEQVAGIITVDPLSDDPLISQILQGDLPIVTADSPPANFPAPRVTVRSDHEHGMRLLLDHLWEQGARRPALIAPGTNSEWGRVVLATFTQWCSEHGAPPVVVDVSFVSQPDEIMKAATSLLEASPRPDAIIAAPEGAAVGTAAAASARGLRVGEDVLIASCVESVGLQVTTPLITTIALHARRLGERCATLMLETLAAPAGERPAEPIVETVPVSLVIRESTLRKVGGGG